MVSLSARSFTRTVSLVLAASSAGCAHYYLPVGELESSEVTRAPQLGKIEFAQVWSGPELSSDAIFTANDPTTGAPTAPVQIDSLANYAFGGTKALGDGWEIGVRFPLEAPLQARAKKQWYGLNDDGTSSGKFSAAAAISTGVLLGNENGGGSTLYWLVDLGQPVGYRLNARSLVLLTPYLKLAGVSLPEKSASATLYGAALGFQYQLESLFFMVEVNDCKGSFGPSALGGIYGAAEMGLTL